jgi:hypothetical protein
MKNKIKLLKISSAGKLNKDCIIRSRSDFTIEKD